jgi:DNA (cytosine-5)-methyltransferase 1
MKKTFEVVDMFCGAGGESTGILQSAAERGMKIHLTAINHWERAIETHAANHPGAERLCQSVERIDPTKAVPGQRLDLLWASPECTHHSIARGGRPRSDQSRASAWMVLKWLSELYVERVIIENVPEFLSWGPLDDAGRPIQSRKGKTFRAFISSIRSLGYTVDWKILVAADYGDPTTRRRLFIQAAKGRKRILWPRITHIDGAENLLGRRPWRPARDIIDWSIPGASIFDRKRPLSPATMRRIAVGIEKYWKDCAKPFLAVLYGSNDVRSLDLPLPTVTTSGNHHALVEPFVTAIGQNSVVDRSRSIDEPLSTIVGKREHCLIEPFITRRQGSHEGEADGDNRNHGIDRPLPTVDTSNRYGLVEPPLVECHGVGKPYPASLPAKTVTTKDHFALLEPFICAGGDSHGLVDAYGLDIRFRMLKSHELKRAQGFPDDYVITGNITERTKQIGNAVPVNTAKALALAAMGGDGIL